MTAASTPKKSSRNTTRTPKSTGRRSSGRKSVKQTLKNSTIELDTEDGGSSISDREEQNDDLFEDVTNKNKRSSKGQKLVTSYEKSELIEAHETLIKLSIERISIKSIAKQWSELFSYDKHTALYDLLGLFTALIGSSRVLKSEFIESGFDFDILLTEIEQSLFIKMKTIDKNILPNKQIIFRASKLLGNIMKIGKENILKDELALDVIINFVCTFSKSKYRIIRSIFTTIAIQIITSLCELERDISKEQELINTQLIHLNNEDSRKNKNKIKKLSEKIQTSSLVKLDIEKITTTIFNEIFTMRYRDIDSQIRAQCIKALKTWIILLPDMFQKIHNLKYLLWALSDKTNIVRRDCVIAVSAIIGKDELHNAIMEQFIDKLKTRLLEMASKDIDQTVNLTAIQLIETIYKKGKTTNDEVFKIFEIMTNKSPKIRNAVANIFMKYFELELETKTDRIQTFKSIITAIMKIVKNINNSKNKDQIESLILDEYSNDTELNNYFNHKNEHLFLITETLFGSLNQIKDHAIFIECLLDQQKEGEKSKKKKSPGSKKFTSKERLFILKTLAFSLDIAVQKSNLDKNTDPNSALCSLQDTLISNDKILMMLNNCETKEEKVVVLFIVSQILSCESFMRSKKEQTILKVLNEIKSIYHSSNDIYEITQCFKSYKVLLTYDEAEIVLPSEVMKFKHNLISNLKQELLDMNNKIDKFVCMKTYCSLVVYSTLLSPFIIDIDTKDTTTLFNKLVSICSETFKTNNEIFYFAFNSLCRSLFYVSEQNRHKISSTTDSYSSNVYTKDLESLIAYKNKIVEIAIKFIDQKLTIPKDLKKLDPNALHVRKTVFVSLCDLLTLTEFMSPGSFTEHRKYIDSIDKTIEQFSDIYDKIENENNPDELKICLDAFVTYIRLIIQGTFKIQKFSILALKYNGKLRSKTENRQQINNSYSGILDKCIEHFFNTNLTQKLLQVYEDLNNRENIELLENIIESMFGFAVEKFDQWYIDQNNNVDLLLKCNNLAQLISRSIEISVTLNRSQQTASSVDEVSQIVAQTHLKIIQKVLPTINEYIQDSTPTEKDPLKIFYVLQCLLNKTYLTPSHSSKLIENIELEFTEAIITPSRDSNVYYTFYSYFDELHHISNPSSSTKQ